MFVQFFFLLRKRGLNISLNEWMTLLEALQLGLHNSSLSDFYYLCRSILVHDEADFDKYDQAFLEFFKDIPFGEEIPDEVMSWLNKPLDDIPSLMDDLLAMGFPEEDIENLLNELKERIKEQDEEHNGGGYWVGTRGTSPFGNSGWHPNGIRIDGESRHRTAMSVAGERKFRDFRKDSVIDSRQFQLAFKTLRQLSNQVITSEKEFDIDGTIRATCDNGGNLKIKYKHPRKNAVKLILLMDSGGSMDYYSLLCSTLFQAAVKSNHFKELHTFFFHNCIYDKLWKDPKLMKDSEIDTNWLLDNFDGEYRVLIVGDAAMNRAELLGRNYNWLTGEYTSISGYSWLEIFKRHFPHLVWINPEPTPEYVSFWTETQVIISELISMYQLTADGLELAMKELMVRKA